MNYETNRKNRVAKTLFTIGVSLFAYECYKPTVTTTSMQLARRMYSNEWIQYTIRPGDTIKCFRENEKVIINLETLYYKTIIEYEPNFESRNIRSKDVLYAGDALWLPDINANGIVGCNSTQTQTAQENKK